MDMWLIYRRIYIVISEGRYWIAATVLTSLLISILIIVASRPVYQGVVRFRVSWDPYFTSSDTLRDPAQRELDVFSEEFEARKKMMMDRVKHQVVLDDILQRARGKGDFADLSDVALADKLAVATDKGADTFTVTVSDYDPVDTKKLANYVAESYISVVQEMNHADRAFVTAFLKNRYKEVYASLEKVREDKRKMLSETTYVPPAYRADALSMLYRSIELMEVERNTSIAEWTARRATYANGYDANFRALQLDRETTFINEMRRRALEMEARKEYLQGTFTAESPQIKDMNRALDTVYKAQKALEDNPNPAYIDVSMVHEKVQNDTNISGFKGGMPVILEAKANFLTQLKAMPEIMKRYDTIMTNEDILSTQLHEVSKNLEQAVLNERILPINVRIYDYAREPENAVSPNKPRILITGLLLGLIVSCMALLLREIVLRPLRLLVEAREILQMPVLAAVPDVRVRRSLRATLNRFVTRLLRRGRHNAI